MELDHTSIDEMIRHYKIIREDKVQKKVEKLKSNQCKSDLMQRLLTDVNLRIKFRINIVIDIIEKLEFDKIYGIFTCFYYNLFFNKLNKIIVEWNCNINIIILLNK